MFAVTFFTAILKLTLQSIVVCSMHHAISKIFACRKNYKCCIFKQRNATQYYVHCNVCTTAKNKDNGFAFYIFRQQESVQEELEKKLDQAENQLAEAKEQISQLEAEVRRLEDNAASQRSNLMSKPAKKTVRSGQQRASRQESKRKQT